MNSSLARLLLVAQNGGGAGGGQQLWDDYSSNYNYNHNNYDHNVAQSSLQLQGWEFSQPTNHNYTTPSLSFYNNNSNEDGVLSQLPNLASLTSHTSFQNPSSSGGGSTSSSASTCSLLYGNPAGSYFFDDILGPLVKRRHRLEHASTAFVPIAALSPSCQALGCKSDLRFSKHYHRRHKVCELHSKAASVVINGNPQRFCQQCSRFHSLSEFDDGKRSCRKRLADHNRRRRKPQAINYSTTTIVVATSSNSTSNDSSTNTTSSNTTTTSTTNTTTDTTRTMSIAFRNNTTSSKSNHINDHLGQENKEKKGQSKEQIIHINYSSNSKNIGSILSLSGNQVDLQSIPLQLHSPNVLSNNNTNNNNNGFFVTTLQNHQKHHVEEKPHHHHIVEEEEEEEEEDKKELLSEDYYFFSKSNNNGGNFEGLF